MFGGLDNETRICELNIEGFEVYDEGFWTVQVEHKDNNGTVGQETEQFEITSNKKSDLVLTGENGVSGTTDDFMKFTCVSVDGIPHPFRYKVFKNGKIFR